MSERSTRTGRDLSVYKDAGVWRWTCRRLPCTSSDRRDRYRDAVTDGLAHLARHDAFGFRPWGQDGDRVGSRIRELSTTAGGRP